MFQIFNDLTDFFLPRFCVHCKVKLNSQNKFICDSCYNNIQTADSVRIKKEFDRKFKDKRLISEFIPLFVFEKDKELQSLIHALKYEQKFLVGKFLGEKIAGKFAEKIKSHQINFIIPVPLHHLKKTERGYNQAFYIAKGIGNRLKIPVLERVVKRIKFTQSQTKLSLAERHENMKDAFKVKKEKLLIRKNVLLVDDVITTGATTNACANVLKDAGTNKIIAASVAIAD